MKEEQTFTIKGKQTRYMRHGTPSSNRQAEKQENQVGQPLLESGSLATDDWLDKTYLQLHKV